MKPAGCIIDVSHKNYFVRLTPRYIGCLFYNRFAYNFKENIFKQHFKFLYGILMIGVTEMGVYDFHL